jgi:exodeoxyribonuclease VII large subunit
MLSPYEASLERGAAQLQSLSPLKVLSRGYSIAYDQNGRIIDSIDAVDLEAQLRIRLADGSLACYVSGKQHEQLPGTIAEV